MRWDIRSDEKQMGVKIIVFLCLIICISLFSGCTRQEADTDSYQEAETEAVESSQADSGLSEEDRESEKDRGSEKDRESKAHQDSEEDQGNSEAADRAVPGEESGQPNDAAKEVKEMKMLIKGTEVKVAWEDNESVDALREMAAEGLEIDMSMYGGFEQVGQIGQDIPSDDKQITTESGDIVLYSGDQLVVFYGSNSWAYTRLGHITDKSETELEELLGNGDTTITINIVDTN